MNISVHRHFSHCSRAQWPWVTLVAPIVDATNRKHFCHCRKFFWTAPLYKLVKTYDAPASLPPPVLSWFPTICTYVPSMLPAFWTTDSTSEDYHILDNNSFFLLSFSFMPMLDTRRYIVSFNPSIILCVGCCHPTLEKRKWRLRWMKWLAQGHTAKYVRTRIWIKVPIDCRPCFLLLCLIAPSILSSNRLCYSLTVGHAVGLSFPRN